MTKFTLSIVASAAVLLAACGKKEEAPATAAATPAPAAAPAAPAPGGEAIVVKIGHVGPTSGTGAHLGKDNEMGARMAIDDLNAKGVTIGGQKVKFELLAEDDASDPKQGTAAAQKLVDAKVQGVIGHLNSGTTIPASQLYNAAGIPQISPSATNPKYTRQGYNTAFRVVADDVHLGGTLGRYAVSELKGKTIAIIDDRTAYGQGLADEFDKAVKAAGGTPLERQFTTDKATDFTAILTAIKAKKPDVVFFGGMDAVAGPMMRQMKQLGVNAKFMGGDGICTGELPKLAGGAMADGQVVCAEAGGVEGEQKAAMEAFREKFKAKFGVDVQLYAPYVYDAVNVMVVSMEKAGSPDPAKYLPELHKADYNGVTGHIAFDDKGDIKNGALTLYTYKDGKREQIAVVR
ncbi:MAG TPA: branched-chain amino acid ABC transporter substrate-binding protein [Rubrivivax sp.]|nr:branched-chain amino acid ABC transporter substrate-binding protein [Rubrivivax sp.]